MAKLKGFRGWDYVGATQKKSLLRQRFYRPTKGWKLSRAKLRELAAKGVVLA